MDISSVSLDEKSGSVRIIIDGEIPVHHGADDPIVELFRPIRLKYRDEVFFTILTYHRNGCVLCDLIPSNRRDRTVEELLRVSLIALKGDSQNPGVLVEYQKILEKYFFDEDGMGTYLSLSAYLDEVNEDTDEYRMTCQQINNGIKEFVKNNGLTMPSLKKVKKPKKTKAEKRASSEAYLKAHPEILNKKPAN